MRKNTLGSVVKLGLVKYLPNSFNITFQYLRGHVNHRQIEEWIHYSEGVLGVIAYRIM